MHGPLPEADKGTQARDTNEASVWIGFDDGFELWAELFKLHLLGEHFKKEVEKKYGLNTQLLGPDAKDSPQVRVVNRILTWTTRGVDYGADPRHAELVMKDLGLDQAKGVTTPGTKEGGRTKEHKFVTGVVSRCHATWGERSPGCAGPPGGGWGAASDQQ